MQQYQPKDTDKKRNQIVKVELLFVCDGLDVETECGTDNAGVFPIDLQDNGSLPWIIKPAAKQGKVF